MTDIYDRAKRTAARLLAPRSRGGKGLEMTLRRTTTGDYDPATGGVSVTTVDYAGSAFRDSYSRAEIDGTLIRADDAKLLLSPIQLDGTDLPSPEQQDRIIFDGNVYSIVAVRPWNYAGLAVGFEVQARK